MRPDPNDVMGRLFQAVGDGTALLDALRDVGAAVGADNGQALLLSASSPVPQANFGFRPDDRGEHVLAAYESTWRALDPRFALAARRSERALSDVAVLDQEAFERSPIVNEFLAPLDVRYSLFGNFAAGATQRVALAYMRPRRAGHFDAETAGVLDRLAPHVGGALRLHELVGSMQRELHDLRRALDCVPSALLLLEHDGRIACANAAAERLLQRGDGVGVERGILIADGLRSRSALARALGLAGEALRAGRADPRPLAGLRLPRRHGPPLELTLLPLPRPELSLGTGPQRLLAVVHDPEAAVQLDPPLLAQLHGLTATEAELAATLASGRTLADFARERGCTEQTARTHLKRIFAKTGLGRQAELVRVLVASAAAYGLQR